MKTHLQSDSEGWAACGQYVDAKNVKRAFVETHEHTTCRKCLRIGNGIRLTPFVEALRSDKNVSGVKPNKNGDLCDFYCDGLKVRIYFFSAGVVSLQTAYEHDVGKFTTPRQLLTHLAKRRRSRAR